VTVAHSDPASHEEYVHSISATSPQRNSWRDSAACRQVDTEIFFPVGRGASADIERLSLSRATRSTASGAVMTRTHSGCCAVRGIRRGPPAAGRAAAGRAPSVVVVQRQVDGAVGNKGRRLACSPGAGRVRLRCRGRDALLARWFEAGRSLQPRHQDAQAYSLRVGRCPLSSVGRASPWYVSRSNRCAGLQGCRWGPSGPCHARVLTRLQTGCLPAHEAVDQWPSHEPAAPE
jgi:hypothetical protein